MEQNPRQPRRNKPEIGLRARALGILARREYSRPELARKLAQYTDNPDEIPELLDEFERRGWLSESRVVEQVLASRRRRFGAHRIVHELREKGVSAAAIAGAQKQLKDSEMEAAREVWRKRFGVFPADARDKARQMRFLLGRGFNPEVVRRLLRDTDE